MATKPFKIRCKLLMLGLIFGDFFGWDWVAEASVTRRSGRFLTRLRPAQDVPGRTEVPGLCC